MEKLESRDVTPNIHFRIWLSIWGLGLLPSSTHLKVAQAPKNPQSYPSPVLPSESHNQCPAAHRTFSLGCLIASLTSHDQRGALDFPFHTGFSPKSPHRCIWQYHPDCSSQKLGGPSSGFSVTSHQQTVQVLPSPSLSSASTLLSFL